MSIPNIQLKVKIKDGREAPRTPSIVYYANQEITFNLTPVELNAC